MISIFILRQAVERRGAVHVRNVLDADPRVVFHDMPLPGRSALLLLLLLLLLLFLLLLLLVLLPSSSFVFFFFSLFFFSV